MNKLGDGYPSLIEKLVESAVSDPTFNMDSETTLSFQVRGAYMEGVKVTMGFELTIRKLGGGMYDAGLVSILVSDEEMPNELLDRYNELKAIKGTG